MGRMNRSRKRCAEMNRQKRVRYAEKELARLKKTLGLVDEHGNEIAQEVQEIATVTTAEEIKEKKLSQEEVELSHELEEEREKGDQVKVVNEKTGKVHIYNSKTLKDQHGSYPPWFKPRKTAKRIRKRDHARKKNFKQAWTTVNVPL